MEERVRKENHMPTTRQLLKAHKIFQKNETRDLFYRAATDLVRLAIERRTELTLAEAIAVLLQTWNVSYYRFRKFDAKHFSQLEGLVDRHRRNLLSFRKRRIDSLRQKDISVIKGIFADFEKVLGPVGAAKSLHLLAPRFFPLWDRKIASKYRMSLRKAGTNARRYCDFALTAKDQCSQVRADLPPGHNPLKLIDEFNYCKYTRDWM